MPSFWASDFIVADGRLRVRKTGADMALDAPLIAEGFTWFLYFVPVKLKAVWTRLTRPGPAVWFTPERPRPWYLVWTTAAWAGVRIADRPEEAQAAFYFDDVALGASPNNGPARRFNFGCTDVTKSHVARVFGEVFGYPLMVDPTTHAGPLVEKGEDNGAHDGRIVQAPCPALPGKSYQRLIDNTEGDLVADLRTPCVAGRPVTVFIKRRPVNHRFANHNSGVEMATPESLFSPEEIERIGAFCRAMRMDWGGLDILRDRDGRIYVVDVNKTDMGPPIALPLRDKLHATSLLAAAFLHLINHEAGAEAE